MMNSMKQMKSSHSNTKNYSCTTSLARRALILVSFLALSLGSVWGQTIKYKEVEYTKQGDKYVFTPTLLQYWQEIADDYYEEFGISASDVASKLYIRWYLGDNNGEEFTTQSQANFVREGMNYVIFPATNNKNNTYYKYKSFSLWDDEFEKSIGYNMTFSTTENPENYRLVCITTTNTASSFQGYYGTDPGAIQVKYIYSFKPAVTEIPEIKQYTSTSYFNSDTKITVPPQLQTWEELATDCDADKENLANNLYVRWYFEDANGNEQKIAYGVKGNEFVKVTPSRGYFKYGGFDANSEYPDLSPTINVPQDYDENLRLVCIATNKASEYTNVKSWIGDPKEIYVKYVYTLKSVPSKPKTLYYDDENKTTPTLLQYWEEMAEDCGAKGDKEALAENLNVRWYFEDENGNELKEDFAIESVGDIYTKNGNINGYCKFSGFTSVQFDDNYENTDLNPTITIPEGYENKRLVCAVINKPDETTGDDWAENPENIKVKYVYTLKKAAKPADMPITLLYDPEKETCTPTLLESLDEVAKDLGVNRTTLNDNLYVRWYFEDSDGNPLTEEFSIDGDIYAETSPNLKNGYYKYGGFGNSQTSIYNPVISVPYPKDEIENVRLVCLATAKTAGYPDGYWIGDPTEMQVKYVYTLKPSVPIPTKEKVIVYDEKRQCSPHLLQYWREVAIDCNANQAQLQNNFYIRWYFEDENGNALMEDFAIAQFGSAFQKATGKGNGYYKNGGFSFWGHGTGTNNIYVPTFTLPNAWNLDKVRLVCLVTTKATNSPAEWEEDMEQIQMKYVYTLKSKASMENSPFVHYQGEAYRYLKEKAKNADEEDRDALMAAAEKRDFMKYEKGVSQNNYVWDIDANAPVLKEGTTIRQDVHTWEYDIYIADGENARDLILPFQNYKNNGEDKEPRGYIRWYNWATDRTMNKIEGVDNTEVHGGYVMGYAQSASLKKTDYGWIATCLEQSPTARNVGLKVQKRPYNTDHTPFDIACDVSKYADGMDESYTYLLHEPTLSSRYIFHIRPASELGDELEESKKALEEAKEEGSPAAFFAAMSKLKEDKGKVVVSLEKGNSGAFSLRFNQQDYDYYFLKNGGAYSRSTGLKWCVYFDYVENGETKIAEKDLTGLITDRIKNFTYNDFVTDYDDGIDASSIEKFHVVGYACGNDDASPLKGEGLYAPVVHYELNFIEAPHIPITDLTSDNVDDENIDRTDAYMTEHYDLVALLDCDGNADADNNGRVAGNEPTYFSTSEWDDAPTSSADNMSYVPFPWGDIQYSFSYPTLTHTLISPTFYNLGASPAHGDYTMIKSMNVEGISKSRPETNIYGQNTMPYEYYWWDPTELHDYTWYATGGRQHGSFLYTDASDESRSIATIPFKAKLCTGSYIYFTAAIANMTQSGTDAADPQLLISIVNVKKDDEGNVIERKRVVTFHTGVMDGDHGKWYQFYGKAILPIDAELNGLEGDFEAEIVNYASKAYGADFAIDQLAVYICSSKVLLSHEVYAGCDDLEGQGKVKIYMDSENLQNAFGKGDEPINIKWRICREDNDEIVKGPNMYPRPEDYKDDGEADEDREYGVSTVIPNFDAVDGISGTVDGYGWYKEDGTYYFQLANKVFPELQHGESYYVSVYDENSDTWGSEKLGLCTIYSEFFLPLRQYVTYYKVEDEEGGDLIANCGTAAAITDLNMVLRVADATAPNGLRKFNNIPFDYAFYPANKWNSEDKLDDDTDYTYEDLRDAWLDYRGALSEYNGKNYHESGLATEYKDENPENYAVLEYAVNKGLLLLSNSSTFTYDFGEIGEYEVTCLPTIQSVEMRKNTTVTLCLPYKVVFRLMDNSGPGIDLGFSDVEYPDAPTKYTRVVRVGLEQLTNMQRNNEGYLLHIPVHSYNTDKTDEEKLNTGTLEIVSDYLTLTPNIRDNQKRFTDDPAVTDAVNVATFEGIKVNKENMYISVNFHGDGVTKQTFREGYTYYMSFQVKNEGADEEDANYCAADVHFLLKVVPEYVTWNDGSKEQPEVKVTKANENVNKNWNNDANWSRSRKAELYKTVTNSDNYQDNGTEDGENGVARTPATFVPMKFTYVTIPSNNVAPYLLNLVRGTDGIYNNIGDDATGNIQYDMMVRYTEKECLGHDKVGSDEKTTVVGGDIYDCEKFYGNWAKEIYFKPEAELLNQHYLTYEKVWVEKELDANRWTLMSTPLKNTYAGDMYVPSANGRQETEAFRPITFTDKDAADKNIYSRTLYPVYQRSWAQSDAKVYTKTDDVRRTDYSALLQYPADQVTTTFAEWTHTYNDVAVPYSTWKGFAIRAHKKSGKNDNDAYAPALIRLPKADVTYDYYKWDDNLAEDGTGVKQDLNKDNTGKLFTDVLVDESGVTHGIKYDTQEPTPAPDGAVSEPLAEIQSALGYQLVGNPYLCSIDMEKFFEENSDFVKAYYTYGYDEDAEVYKATAYDDEENLGVIRPLQSFFVKVKDGVDAPNAIKFTSAMMIDGNAPADDDEPHGIKRFSITASKDRGQSTATVSVGEEAKSVEALFDSNLDDVPMVYTVANGQAVSYNQVTGLDKPIAFGVTCLASDEMVEVTFSGIEQLTDGELYLLDAVTGEQTAVNETSTFDVQPNDYGRYFLLPSMLDIRGQVDVQQTIMISVRGNMVNVTSSEELTKVSAFAINGTKVYQDTVGGTTASFTLDSGIYIIKAENVAGEQQTVKIIVR